MQLVNKRAFEWMARIGYVANLTDVDRDTLEALLKRDNIADFKEWATGDYPRYTVLYLEPETPQSRAVGFDMASDPKRWAAMDRAIHTEKPAMAGPITLRKEELGINREEALILFVPVFYAKDQIQSDLDREKHTIGFVFAPVLPRHMLGGKQQNRSERC